MSYALFLFSLNYHTTVKQLCEQILKEMEEHVRNSLTEIIKATNLIAHVESDISKDLMSYKKRGDANKFIIEKYEDRIHLLKTTVVIITAELLSIKNEFEKKQKELNKISKAFYTPSWNVILDYYLKRIKETIELEEREEIFEKDDTIKNNENLFNEDDITPT